MYDSYEDWEIADYLDSISGGQYTLERDAQRSHLQIAADKELEDQQKYFDWLKAKKMGLVND